MPRWDKTRNYYADMEVSATASTEEIKKQYKRLVLKWHPDRNPGREQEVNGHFQRVQTAYEILANETLRKEYDDARGTFRSRYPTASGVRGNPWQDISRQYPPPPTRRPQSTAQSRPTSGAQRYASFASGSVPRPGGSPSRDDAHSHQTYSAWQNMRAHARGNPPPPPRPTPGRAPTSATRDSKDSKRDTENPETSKPPPRTASQKQKAEASFGNRKSGYVPRSPGLGDEPPVTNKNYFTTRTHSVNFDQPTAASSSSASAAPQANRPSAMPDPLAQFREKFMDTRQSAPYHTPGGEKTSLFDGGPSIGRTTSTRTPRRPEMPGVFPRPRQRSSSIPRSSGSEESVKGNTGTNGSTNRRTSNINGGFQSQADDRYKPKPNSDNPAGSATADKPAPTSASAGKSATVNGQPAQNNAAPSLYATSSTQFPSNPQQQHPTFKSKPDRAKEHAHRAQNWLEFSFGLPMTSPSSEGPQTSPGLFPLEEHQRREVHRLVSKHPALGKTAGRNVSEPTRKTPNKPLVSAMKKTNVSADHASRVSFSFPVDHDTNGKDAATNRFSKVSTENINTSFVQGEQTADWQFTAGSPTPNESSTPSKSRSQSGSRPIRRPTPAKARPTTTRSMPSTQADAEDTAQQRFSAGEWSEKIGSEHFAPPPSHSASTSPTRRPNSRKAKSVKMTAGTAGLVDNDESEGWQEIPRPRSGNAPAGTNDPVAMDIDSPPAETADDTPKVSQNNGARNIPVEPTRPDWRAGDVNGVPPKAARTTLDTDSAKEACSEKASTQPTSAPTAANAFTVHNGGSEDTEEFRTTLSDLGKTEPFMDPTPTGLKSFADLKSTLPFESRPSEQIPLGKERTPATLEFPTPPVAPRLPAPVAVTSIRPNISQWRKYAQDFYNYMDKWDAFNTKVVDHFSTREKYFKNRRQQRGSAWLTASQSVSSGVEEYMVELQQDQEVRKKWTDACDAHKERVHEFMEFRDRVK